MLFFVVLLVAGTLGSWFLVQAPTPFAFSRAKNREHAPALF